MTDRPLSRTWAAVEAENNKMSYIETTQGEKILKQYLDKFKGKSSQKVYKSEICQFFKFYTGTIERLSKKDFMRYRDQLGKQSKAKTIKRKFSILNQFFKFMETKINGFISPIGQKHGDMQDFRGGTYTESDQFSGQVEQWTGSLICDSTKKTYSGAVRLFFNATAKDPKDLTHDDFVKYRDTLLIDERKKSSTVWNKFIAINSFLKFMDLTNRKFKNPLDFKRLSLVPPKKDKGYYTVLSTQEANKLLRQPDRRTLIGKRDYAILRLMLTYGLRVGEICKLTFQDLETERVKGQQKLWVRDRKGKIGRRADTDIILNGKVLEAFDEWMNNCGIPFKSDTPIFIGFRWQVSRGGLVVRWDQIREKKQLSTRSIEYMVKKYVDKAKLDHGDKVISSHALRHTALTMLARAGVKLIDLKFLAGHQDVSTTLIYLHSVQSYVDHAGMHNPLNR